MSQVGDEVDILLAGAGEIKNGQSHLTPEVGKELFQTATRSRGKQLFIEELRGRGVVPEHSSHGTRD